MYIKREKLVTLIELVKANPEIDTDKLLALIVDDEGQKEGDVVSFPHLDFNKIIFDKLDDDHETEEVRPPRRKNRSGMRWDDAEDKKLIEEHEKGTSVKDIAEMLGRSVKSINIRKDRLASDDIIEPNRQARHYTEVEKFSIKSLFYDYESVSSIPEEEILKLAKELDRTAGAVRTQLYYLERKYKNRNRRSEK